MCTCTCVSRALLQHMDMDPFHQRTFEGSCLIIPCSVQYRTLFPEIIAPCNHQELLIDPDTGKPFPMCTVGDFCLKDKIFLGTYEDSLLFKESNLAKLKKKDIYIPPYTVEKTEPTTSKGSRHESDSAKEGKSTSSHRAEESHKAKETQKTEQSLKTSSQTSTASSPVSRLHQWQKVIQGAADSHSQGEARLQQVRGEPNLQAQRKRPHHDKSGRSEPDKEGGSSIHKRGQSPSPSVDSTGCKPKEPCTEASSNAPHESSCNCPKGALPFP